MKKLEDVKRALEVCDQAYSCLNCQYKEEKASPYGCRDAKDLDALFYIQHFEDMLNQAVEDIRMLGRTGEFICPVCAHYNHGEGKTGECVKCLTGDGFRWRGMQDDI